MCLINVESEFDTSFPKAITHVVSVFSCVYFYSYTAEILKPFPAQCTVGLFHSLVYTALLSNLLIRSLTQYSTGVVIFYYKLRKYS